ncbi:Peptidyl-prolyl cis-trans isomerase CYP19-3-like protein [Drosera capensis]
MSEGILRHIDRKERAGRIVMELFADTTPKTAENFCALCTGNWGRRYSTGAQHFITSFRASCAREGDFTKGNGTGGESIYGMKFQDENFELNVTDQPDMKHVLSMANAGPNTIGSLGQKPWWWLDGKHVVFGKVVDGYRVVELMERRGHRVAGVLSRVGMEDCGHS